MGSMSASTSRTPAAHVLIVGGGGKNKKKKKIQKKINIR
jgi:hypothetical protein